jgi:hypothetical protein
MVFRPGGSARANRSLTWRWVAWMILVSHSTRPACLLHRAGSHSDRRYESISNTAGRQIKRPDAFRVGYADLADSGTDNYTSRPAV